MSLTVNDGKATPVAHVFTTDAVQNGSDPSELVNRANANGPNFWERVKILSKLAPANRPKQFHVAKIDTNLPIQGTVDGNPAVVGRIRVVTTVMADQSVANPANMADAIALQRNILADSYVAGQLGNFAPVNA